MLHQKKAGGQVWPESAAAPPAGLPGPPVEIPMATALFRVMFSNAARTGGWYGLPALPVALQAVNDALGRPRL